jgi:hypothetical protein
VKKTRRSVLGRQTFKVQEFANKVHQLPCGIAGSSDVWNWPASFRCIKDQPIEHEKKLNRNHRSSSWSSTTPTVCEEVLGRHSKFSLVACCHLCGMTRLPGSYSRAMHSFFADIISELILSFKARCKFLSLHAVGFTNTKMVGSDMVVGCNESISYLLWFCSN